MIFVEAAIRLAFARLLTALVPFRLWARRYAHESAQSAGDGDAATIRRVRRAVLGVSRRAPWRCQCLEQALAATAMLRARRIPSTLYLGITKRENENVAAHAWVRSGDVCVTGGAAHDRFAVMAVLA